MFDVERVSKAQVTEFSQHKKTKKLNSRTNVHITNMHWKSRPSQWVYFLPLLLDCWTHLGQMYQEPQKPPQWPSLWGQLCSRSETPGHRWRPWAGRWWWLRWWNRPSRSGSLWEERKRTGPSRRQWGSAWHSQNRTAAVLLLCRLRPHLLVRSGAEWGEMSEGVVRRWKVG